MAGPEWPDIEQIIVDYLTDRVPSAFSCLELPPAADFQARLPIVLVARIGGPAGTPTWSEGPVFDNPTMDLLVHATQTATQTGLEICNATIKAARAAITDLKGYTAGGAGITRVRETAGPAPRPGASQNVVRKGFTVELALRALL